MQYKKIIGTNNEILSALIFKHYNYKIYDLEL